MRTRFLGNEVYGFLRYVSMGQEPHDVVR
jgi:hypothetical protein